MNVYEKLQTARVRLQKMNLKKSGKNSFAGYDYYELGDFLPAINDLFGELKLFSQVSFTNEIATLAIVNTEKPDEIIQFTSPMSEANLKGCHPVQNLGAVQSYQRRYLYQTALEIVEHDTLDSTTGKEQPAKSFNKPRETIHKMQTPSGDSATEKQIALIKGNIKRMAAKMGASESAVEAEIKHKYLVKDLSEMKKSTASGLIEYLSEQLKS